MEGFQSDSCLEHDDQISSVWFLPGARRPNIWLPAYGFVGIWKLKQVFWYTVDNMVKNRTIGTWSPSSVGDVLVLRFSCDGNHNPAAFVLALMNRTVPGWRYRKFSLFASGFSLFLDSQWRCQWISSRQRAILPWNSDGNSDSYGVSASQLLLFVLVFFVWDRCDILELGCWSSWFLMCGVTDSIRTTDLIQI